MAKTKENILELIRRTPFMWPDAVIHMFMSGSAMHGATGNKPTDTDISGVYIQPVETVLGIPQRRETDNKWFDPDTQVWSSAGDHNKNSADDIDLNLYSLRKWAGMAASGNTTALEFLYVNNMVHEPRLGPDRTVWEKHILPNTEHFISKRAGFHFIAFAKAMLLRLNGGNTGKHGQRPELGAEFGYDCYDDIETEFLTDHGWRKFDAVSSSDKVAAFDLATGEIKFEMPLSKTNKTYSGLLYEVEPQLTRCVVTPNHNMAASPASRNLKTGFSTNYIPSKANWNLYSIGSLMSGVRVRVPRSMYHIRRSGQPRSQRYDVQSEYLLLAGMYLSEGSINFRKNKSGVKVKAARIVQTPEGKDEYCKYADRLIRLFGGHRYAYPRKNMELEIVWTFPRKVAEKLYHDFGHHKDKHLPNWCFQISYEQAWEMWNGMCLGDGTRTQQKIGRGQGTVLYTSLKSLADDVHAMMVSSGHVCVVNGPYESQTEFGTSFMYQIYRPDGQDPYRCVNFKSGILKAGDSPKDGYGYSIKEIAVENRRIVCFEMPSGTLVTRSRGRAAFQGNSKGAMHMLRVLGEGIELMNTGVITLPRPEAPFLRDVRNGKYTWAEVAQLAEARFRILDEQRQKSYLPDEIDRAKVSRIITDAQLEFWGF